MKCPKCGKELQAMPNYTPSKGLKLGTVYSHVYSLKEVLKGNICKYTITVGAEQ